VSVAAGGVYTLDLTSAQKDAVYYDGLGTGTPIYTAITSKSLRVQSNKPVTVYALNQGEYVADATNLLPVNTLGTDYYHFSHTPMSGSDGYTIIATKDGTLVTDNGNTFVMGAGQVYSHYGPFSSGTGEDFTGRHITSNMPIAYFVTNTSTRITTPVAAADNLFQQMMPVSTWGKKIVVPATKRGAERVRIIASQDNTTITQTGGTQVTGGTGSLPTLNKGQFVELEITRAAGGCFISADKPVGVCTYLVSYGYASSSLGGYLPYQNGDPALSLAPPVEQFVNSATITPFIPVGTVSHLDEHYALIVTATANCTATTMSVGNATPTPVSGGWTTGANPAYSFCNIQLTNTAQSYTFANSNGLAILGYGLGAMESYYYLAASAARDLSATFYVNGELYSDVNRKRFCGVSTFHLVAVLENINPSPGYLQWYVDNALTATDQTDWYLPAQKPGEHTIRMQVTDQNGQIRNYETTIRVCSQGIPVNPN
jgi:hypothetical protein